MVQIKKIVKIAVEAGNAIMGIYNSDKFDVEMKSDNSPLTKADKISHKIIKEKLSDLYPDIPVLSEEGREIPYNERKDWELFWLVDPLDGTKEFIKKNGEFTVNIALVEYNEPIMGIIYAPAFNPNTDISSSLSGTLYYADKETGSFKNVGGVTKELPCFGYNGQIKAVRSRSHASMEEEKIFMQHNVTETISIGSSLKFCMVAEGMAHIYYRFGPTNEWDVAAGYAIAKYAGANIQGLSFNKKDLINNSFIVSNKVNTIS
jgi:3'(2'), 5'-bisphosphate nucleotidase